MDEAAKTLVVKDKKGEKTFDVSLAKNMPALKAGDKVSFNYIEKDGKLMAGQLPEGRRKGPSKDRSNRHLIRCCSSRGRETSS